jgi:hypothetical protein
LLLPLLPLLQLWVWLPLLQLLRCFAYPVVCLKPATAALLKECSCTSTRCLRVCARTQGIKEHPWFTAPLPANLQIALDDMAAEQVPVCIPCSCYALHLVHMKFLCPCTCLLLICSTPRQR